jgi:hypothetical protein
MTQFRLDDKVVYTGEKLRGDLAGKMGVIIAPIENNSAGYVVDFGNDSYVMGEAVLAPFQGHLRSADDTRQPEKKERKDLQVEKRRGNKRTAEENGE